MSERLSQEELNRLFDETEAMLQEGTAEVIMETDNLIWIRRADGSGFAILRGDEPQLIRFKYMNAPGEDAPDFYSNLLGIVDDRKPSNEADDILKQVFDEPGQ